MAMLPKGLGSAPLGQRPIGISPRPYRVWCAARAGQMREWGKDMADDWSWGTGKSRGAADA
eukprot:4458376-Alexandrium_andersonii.AAC.1